MKSKLTNKLYIRVNVFDGIKNGKIQCKVRNIPGPNKITLYEQMNKSDLIKITEKEVKEKYPEFFLWL